MIYDEEEAALEASLRSALQREPAPRGFAQRVEARLLAQGRFSATRTPRSMRRSWIDLVVAAALVLAIIVPLGMRLRRQSQLARGEAAKAQVLFALRLTGMQLRSIQVHTHSLYAGTMPEGDTK